MLDCYKIACKSVGLYCGMSKEAKVRLIRRDYSVTQ